MDDEALLPSVISFHHCAFDTLAESQQNTILRHSAPLAAKNGAPFGEPIVASFSLERSSQTLKAELCARRFAKRPSAMT